ncbi:uncharacterized protein K452DRAFT_322164 [Aplosporella prunicola CBS 121167]|uniref:Uncharacterized protein n=1 Tax=Aplosporella prunicola CBS 121167 TaxID=1176127 RepID=A0A6A6AY09_9PEZI|nr:uncharacterized protein K452DRAFT_322164 [Aplosporella prunicola CBS 121167]KAF2136829.1 hypothetical protein K452DRAFT_322164 [Aplosporella prunicola CBS 121167]
MDTLPTELRMQIVEALYEEPPNDIRPAAFKPNSFLDNIRSVRLASRSLNAAASDIFLKTFFHNRLVLLERKSLSRLYQIATTQPFSRYLQHIVVLAYQFYPAACETYDSFWLRMQTNAQSEYPWMSETGVFEQFTKDDEAKADYPKAKAAHKIYQECLEDQQNFYKDFAHVGLLARIIKELDSTLQSVEVEAHTPRAYRSRIMREVPMPLTDEESETAHSQAVSTVVRAMHRSGGRGPCHFEVTGLSLNSIRLPAIQRSRFLQVNVKHLHSLHLFLAFPRGMSEADGSELQRELMNGFLSDFLATAPFLEDIHLHFPERLEFPVPFKALLGKRINKLKGLSLLGISVHFQELARFLTTHKQLERLRLDDILLRSGTWRGIFKLLHKGDFPGLSVFEGHNLVDKHALIHLPGDNVTSYVLNETDEVDWKTMELHKCTVITSAVAMVALLTGALPDQIAPDVTLPFIAYDVDNPGGALDEEPGEDNGEDEGNQHLFHDIGEASSQSDVDPTEYYPGSDSEPDDELMPGLDESSDEDSDSSIDLALEDGDEWEEDRSADEDGYLSDDSATDKAVDAIIAAL